jgi:hypothetical protein
MNNPENAQITTIAPEDVALIEKELAQTSRPLPLHVLAEKLAFRKTAGQRTQDVKRYDPYARYETGDVIFKEYDEALTIGSKNVEHFQGAVVLKVVGKTFYRSFNCEMIEVDYAGGGVFRKYIDYMKKTRTQILLPSNTEARGLVPDIVEKGSDPRLTELSMTERDLKTLQKNLRSALVKFPALFNWNDNWQLTTKRIDIQEAKIKEMEAEFERTRASASTEELVKTHLGLEASNDLFEMNCLSLDYVLDKKYKKEFLPLSLAGWGKWHLKRILNTLPEGLPLAAPLAKLPELEELEKPEMSTVQDFPIKVYLTWREIHSGGIKVPRSLNKGLSHAREYSFTEPEEGKTYTLFYYPSSSYFLGLQDFYVKNNIPQGASLTMEKKGPAQFHFWVKKSKKKLAAVKVAYDPKEDKFSGAGEEAFTFAEPNKIIFVDRETLAALLPLYEQRDELDLKDLLFLIFKNPVLAPGHALHFLRAYHLVDVLKQTTQEDVELTLLNTPEFIKSEKKKGIFFYQEPYTELDVVPEEVALEASAEEGETFTAEGRAERYVPPGTIGFEEEEEEEPFPGGPPEIIDLTPRASKPKAAPPMEAVEESAAEQADPAAAQAAVGAAEKEKAKAAAGAVTKKEKPHKKKKPKLEGEKGPRPKKSERRVIEEKLADEESEMEAMTAIKQKEEGLEEQRLRGTKAKDKKEKKEKKEESKEAAKEEPKFGFFAEKLKSALTQPPSKKEKEDKKKPED